MFRQHMHSIHPRHTLKPMQSANHVLIQSICDKEKERNTFRRGEDLTSLPVILAAGLSVVD